MMKYLLLAFLLPLFQLMMADYDQYNPQNNPQQMQPPPPQPAQGQAYGQPGGAPFTNQLDDFVQELLMTTANELRRRGPAPIKLGGAINQTCRLYHLHNFNLVPGSAHCRPMRLEDQGEVVMQLQLPHIAFECRTNRDPRLPGIKDPLVPDLIKIFYDGSVFDVRGLLDYNSIDNPVMVARQLRKGVYKYDISESMKGSPTERRIPSIYYLMLPKDIALLLPSAFKAAIRTVGMGNRGTLISSVTNCKSNIPPPPPPNQ